MATIRFDADDMPAGFKPSAGAQTTADAIEREFGITSFGTYPNHGSATPRRPQDAMDIFVTKAQGDRLAAWLASAAVRAKYGVWITIWWQRINNSDRDAPGAFRSMADRGSDRANHKDHIHLEVKPTAQPQEDQMNELQAKQLKNVETLLLELKDGKGPLAESIKAIVAAEVAKLPSGGTAASYKGTVEMKPA